jgi:hypothetical protein
MPITLYDALAPSYLQILGGLKTVLAKGLEHAAATGRNPDDLVQARLIADMHPLGIQVQRAYDYSAGALRDVGRGAFTLPQKLDHTYAGLQGLVAAAEAEVRSFKPDAVEGVIGREFIFDPMDPPLRFTAEAYLFSFALPNFYFHAVTAYDILRAEGVPVGKRDYLGELRLR